MYGMQIEHLCCNIKADTYNFCENSTLKYERNNVPSSISMRYISVINYSYQMYERISDHTKWYYNLNNKTNT